MQFSCITCCFPHAQTSMSVDYESTHVIPMPTALTTMAALTAHVGKALKAMGSTVQVCTLHCKHWVYGDCAMSCCRHSRVWKRVGWLWPKCKLYEHIWKLWLQLQHRIHWRWIYVCRLAVKTPVQLYGEILSTAYCSVSVNSVTYSPIYWHWPAHRCYLAMVVWHSLFKRLNYISPQISMSVH